MVAAIVMMLVLGAVLGLGLGIADKYLKVEVDERVEKVTEMLPNYNCGGCGYAGCSGLAQALVSGEIQTVSCRPCKPSFVTLFIAFCGHLDAHMPQLTHLFGSITARLSRIVMACLGHALAQIPQPIQPT